ncbi:hypothetical protein KGQ20_18600 [Catenulispora sp. NF23]|uniref:ESAT-6-like protein n=1 Tax=Catenulispora pinistramenti TaxID=2705254 RepID=A0ABS5KZG6_9ACTN|nr:hypothetical protein [Catenulispora pinistramenti]MBS2534784.1 hypothetical protein [Catenulispora pinistramenti]MBS2551395.1 hypothetical protein [Catenulispora pinistramenti]
MADLVIDTGMLADLAKQLSGIKDQVDNATKFVDGYRGGMGSGPVSDAVHGMADIWSKKRDELDSQLDTLSQIAANASQTYEKTDRDLATCIEKAMSQTKSGG